MQITGTDKSVPYDADRNSSIKWKLANKKAAWWQPFCLLELVIFASLQIQNAGEGVTVFVHTLDA